MQVSIGLHGLPACRPACATCRVRSLAAHGLATLLCILSVIIGLAFSGWAAEGDCTLRAGSFDLPPWGSIENGKPKGVIFDLHADIARRTGLPFINKLYPFRRVAALLANKEIDFTSGQPHELLLGAGDKLALLHTINIIVVTKKGSLVESIDDLDDKVLVYQAVASYPKLDALTKNIQRVNSYEQAINMLRLGRDVDAAVFSEPTFYYFMKKNGYTRSDFGNILLLEKDREDWLFVRRDLPQEIRTRLKRAVEDATSERVYDRLLELYELNGER